MCVHQLKGPKTLMSTSAWEHVEHIYPSSLQIYQLEQTGAMQLDRQLSQIKVEYTSGLARSLLTNI